jgi:VWFA-related protein
MTVGAHRWPVVLAVVAAIAAAPESAARSAPDLSCQDRPSAPAAVFRITTALIQFDAQVTDSGGRPITSLTRDDFEVLQDGVRVPLRDAAFIDRHPLEVAADRSPVVGVDVEPLVFLIDDMAMSPDAFARIRTGLRDVVSCRLPAGVEVGILRTGETGRRTTRLTAAPDVLLARIDAMRYLARSYRRGLVSGSGASGPGGPQLERTFVEGTLGSITSLLADLRRLPGRKVVVLLSEGVALDMGDGEALSASVEERMNRLAQLAAVAGVTLHGVDVSGVRGAPTSLRLRASLRDGLVSLAERMGGRFLEGGNELTQALRRLAALERGYYLLSYEPPDGTFVTGKPAPFRRLTVRVRRQGVDVRTRSGFFGATE